MEFKVGEAVQVNSGDNKGKTGIIEWVGNNIVTVEFGNKHPLAFIKHSYVTKLPEYKVWLKKMG